ncbi:hypothetical protein PR048_021676 [Dryococelus australis]|uniref:Uncharacterized protein n=1 Tax=Dryococelus australis TaxID=614101 RepID=A0ABQ9GYY6_9NEOP|nr:hypothetical protein PR048_021676 [Dryococelus australis]
MVVHVPGKFFYVPDTVTRAAVGPPGSNSDAEEEDLFIQSVIAHTPFPDTRLEEIRKAKEMDAECGFLKKQIVECFGDAAENPQWAHGYDQMSQTSGRCAEQKHQRAEPMKMTELSQGPWISLGMDILELSRGKYIVKIAKKILSKLDDPNLELLAYRATPLENGFSPSELLFGRKLRTTLPVIRATQQQPGHQDREKFYITDKQLKQRNKANFDQRHGARKLRELVVGEQVWIPNLKQYGEVHAHAPFPRSFIVQIEQGLLRQNRVQLIPAPSNEMHEKLHGKSGEQYCHIPLTHHNQ